MGKSSQRINFIFIVSPLPNSYDMIINKVHNVNNPDSELMISEVLVCW